MSSIIMIRARRTMTSSLSMRTGTTMVIMGTTRLSMMPCRVGWSTLIIDQDHFAREDSSTSSNHYHQVMADGGKSTLERIQKTVMI